MTEWDDKVRQTVVLRQNWTDGLSVTELDGRYFWDRVGRTVLLGQSWTDGTSVTELDRRYFWDKVEQTVFLRVGQTVVL